MSLAKAIDEAVEYVRSHAEQMTRPELEEFRGLAADVLPPQFSLLDDPADEPTSENSGEPVFMVCAPPRWFHDMAVLCSLSDSGSTPEAKGDEQQPDNWGNYRNGPGGPLLTPKLCRELFNVTGTDLTRNAEAKRTRKNNPNGRGHVYRYDVVSRISNRKPISNRKSSHA